MPRPSVIVASNPGFPSSLLSLAVREIRELEGKPWFEASVIPGPHKLTGSTLYARWLAEGLSLPDAAALG